MFRFLVVLCVLAIIALFGLLAGGADGPPADVVLVNGAEVHELDPARMSWMHDIRTAYGLWEGLLSLNPRTMAPEPAVAHSYDVSPDGRVYTFHLRPDARWSNGDPVTADDFRWSWLRVMDPATAADYYSYMFLIEGAEQHYNALKTYYDRRDQTHDAGQFPSVRPDGAGVGVDVLDSHTLRVRLVRPVPYFPELIAFATFLPVHRGAMERFYVDRPGQLPFYDPRWLQPPNLVSNGPFVLDRWEFRYRLVLTRNPFYWDQEHVAAERLDLLANDDVNTAFLAYENRQADVLTKLPEAAGPTLLERHRQGRREDLKVFLVWGTYYYRFNCKRAPFDDARVRKALAMAIDREAIVRHVTRQGERAQSSFVTPGLTVQLPPGRPPPTRREGPGWRLWDDGRTLEYVPVEGLPFDPAAARALLAEAGYGPGGRPLLNPDGGRVALLTNNSPTHLPIAQAVTKMWREHLGVDIGVDAQDSNIFRVRLKGHRYEVGRSNWFTDYGDPTGFLVMFQKDDGNNDGQFDVPEFDRLFREADDQADPARRFELIHQAERILVVEQAGVAPIYQSAGQYLYRPDVVGIHAHPKQQIMLKYVGKTR